MLCEDARRTYEDGRPEAAEPVILPAPDDVENAADEHEQADDNEQPPGARFLVVDLHFLDDDDFRSHCGDCVGGLVVARCVKAASDERRRAQLVRRLRQDGARVRTVALLVVSIGSRVDVVVLVAAASAPEQQVAPGRSVVLSRVQRTTVVVETDAVVAVRCARHHRCLVITTAGSRQTTGAQLSLFIYLPTCRLA